MAYVILSSSDRELNRVELQKSPLVVGRSPDCEISIHDILLSRRHCRLTPTSDGWLVIDMGSRNGTTVGGRKIEQRRLKDGDIVVLGKTSLTFRAGEIQRSQKLSNRPALPLPVDPGDTANGTVFAMEYVEASTTETPGRKTRAPSPKPRPSDPQSFESDDVYSMLDQITSSSWDSVYAVNLQPLRRDRQLPRPRVVGNHLNATKKSPSSSQAGPIISLVLQVGALPAVPVPVLNFRSPRSQRGPLGRRLSRFTRMIGQIGKMRLF